MMAKDTEFKAIAAYERYYNEDSLYGVYVVRCLGNVKYAKKVSKDLFSQDDCETYYETTVVGSMQRLYVGSEYTFLAHASFASKYKSWQYTVSSVYATAPKTPEEQRVFLNSIITPRQIEIVTSAYPNIVQDVLDEKEIDTSKFKGIGDTIWQKIKDKILENYLMSDVITLLQPVGVTFGMIKKLVATFGNAHILKEEIKKNPYMLTRVHGLGFKRVDEIALKLEPTLLVSDKRMFAFVKYYLNCVADQEGHTWVLVQKLKNAVIDYIPQCLRLFEEKIENPNTLSGYLYKENNCIGVAKYKETEDSIYSILKSMENYKCNCKIDTEQGIKQAEDVFGYELTEEQRNVVRQIEKNNVVLFTGSAGCVDADTEFFNGYKWCRIADYNMHDKVLQYNADGTAGLVYPERYIKTECDTLWHFKTKYGLDQCLSDDHNCYYISQKGIPHECSFSEIRESQAQGKFNGRFKTSFLYSGEGIKYSDSMIRLFVAAIADGSFYYNSPIDSKCYTKCRFHIKKERKKQRLIFLFINTGVEYFVSESAAEGYTDFYCMLPERMKVFPADWYGCTQEQLKVITDEALFWDGSIGKGNRIGSISTTVKENADFLQFAYSATGHKASITVNDRSGQQYSTCGKMYTRKSAEYRVSITSRNLCALTADDRNTHHNTEILPYKPTDGYKYCFTVPSHYLVLRRNNCIFITGNCGKSSSARAILNSFQNASIACCSLSAKAAQRIREATGYEATTIHRLLGVDPKTGGFVCNSGNRLSQDVVFLDEASMLNCQIFYDLISSVKEGAKLIICGDYLQLPPIGAGNVFSDIIHMPSQFNVSVLTKVHRQASKSGILTDANKIRAGECPIETPLPTIVSGELEDMVYAFRDNKSRIQNIAVNQFVKLSKQYGIDNVVLAVPRKDIVENSAYELNRMIQKELIKTKEQPPVVFGDNKFYVGDRILQIVNDYEKDTYNGEVGYVTEVVPDAKPEEICLTARFELNGVVKITYYSKAELNEILLGYSMSIHKLQGSEYQYTIVDIDSTHAALLDSCLLYTAITRAKKKCLLVAEPSAFKMAISKNKSKTRQTWLKLKGE